MNNFDGPLVIQFDAHASDVLGGNYWRVMKSFRFFLPVSRIANEWTCYDTNKWGFVPAGILTDLGSVPMAFRSIIDNGGRAAQAYVLHDQLCEYLSLTENGRPVRITRVDADNILHDALISLGVDRSTARIIYEAVALYRRVTGVDWPTNQIKKRELEAAFNFEGLQ